MRALFVLACLLPLVASAQRSRPFAQKGDVALVVAIPAVNILNLEPAFGGVGLRYRVADRYVLGGSAGFQTQDVSNEGRNSEDYAGLAVTGSLWLEHHIGRRAGSVSPLYGLGLTAQTSSFDATYVREETVCTGDGCTTLPVTYDLTNARTAVGAGALLGVELRLARQITLGAAYVVGLEVSSQRSESPREGGTVDAFESDGLRAGTGLTDLHLSIYF